MKLTKKLTLASKSQIRAQVLRGAGLDFEIAPSGVDEDVLKQIKLEVNKFMDYRPLFKSSLEL